MISSERLALRLSSLCYAFAFAATLLEAPLLFSADVAHPTLLRGFIGLLVSSWGIVSPNVISAFVQLIFYRRLQSDGGRWFGYAWETQLDETGLLCFVLALAPDGPSYLARFSRFCARSALHLLAFRVMLAAGLLKMRAHEECWKDHTCLHHHFTTNPQPTPLSFYAAQLPPWAKSWMQWASIDVAELILPFGFLLEVPRLVLLCIPLPGMKLFSLVPLVVRWIAATGTLGLMVGIQATGNYSFLQLLTAIPCTAALGRGGGRDSPQSVSSSALYVLSSRLVVFPRAIMTIFLTIALAIATHPGFFWLTTGSRAARSPLPWVTDLIGGGSTFSSGRFASMTKIRDEPSIHVLRCVEKEQDCERKRTDETDEHSQQEHCYWEEVDITCKVGSVSRRPCFTSPLHRRFAWQWWFIGLGGDKSFMVQWLRRLQQGDPEAWFALEVSDDESWKVRAVTVRMHRYTWNHDKPYSSDTVIVEGHPLVDRADGLWWSRSSGRSLATLRMSTTWERRNSMPHRWWNAISAWSSRAQKSTHQSVAVEVWTDLQKECTAWCQRAWPIVKREYGLLRKEHILRLMSGIQDHSVALMKKAHSILGSRILLRHQEL